MTDLFAAIAAFILSHAIPAVKPLRAYLVRAMGFRMYVALYSMMSVGILVWLVFAYSAAPFIEVWEFRDWTRWITIVLMLPAIVLLPVGLLSPNPLSLSLVSPSTFDAARPGIVGLIRHPVIWAIALWALAHIPPNGDLASLFMFSLLLMAGLSGLRSLDARRRASLGEAEWMALTHTSGGIKGLKIWPLLAGLVLYAILFHFHQWVIGVPPL